MIHARTFLITAVSAAALATAACSKTETAAPAEATPAPMATTASTDPVVGGAPMSPSADIVTNASKSADHTTLVSAVKAAGLVETLQGPGPFTVFAPTNAAFGKLPAGTVESLTQPAQKDALTKILTYHVVPGRLMAADIAAQAAANGGTATLTTVEGGKLMVKDAGGGQWQLTDEKGGTSMITMADVGQSNGVVHVVDTVLMPN